MLAVLGGSTGSPAKAETKLKPSFSWHVLLNMRFCLDLFSIAKTNPVLQCPQNVLKVVSLIRKMISHQPTERSMAL